MRAQAKILPVIGPDCDFYSLTKVIQTSGLVYNAPKEKKKNRGHRKTLV